MSDLNLTVQEGDDVYLSITETPAVVTLSQAVISGALASTVTVANTVTVALDANSLAALESVTVTVGNVTIGSSVSISNFPASQQVSGTVSVGSIPAVMLRGSNGDQIDQEGAYIPVAGVNSNPVGISGTVTANIFGLDQDIGTYNQIPVIGFDTGIEAANLGNVVPVQISNTSGVIGQGNPLPISGTVTANVPDLLNLDADGNVFVSLQPGSTPYTQPVSGTVTVGNSVTIGSLPVNLSTTTIGGTARLNVTLSSATTLGATVPSYGNLYGGSDGTNFRAINVDSSGRTVVTGSISVANLPSTQTVAGTVTANVTNSVTIGAIPSTQSGQNLIGGSGVFSVLRIKDNAGTYGELQGSGTLTYNLPVYGTVTVSAMPSGTLTTRFGTPTTASTAFLTTAVTNTSRKYLLIQNVTTASNVITVGIGFTPTTTQGIQLAAGAGITFESSYIPTGAVWVLSSVTASNYTILEA